VTVSTAAPGRPQDVYAVAGWLRSSLGSGLDATAGDLRSVTGARWEGAAGDAFRARTTTSAEATAALAGSTAAAARVVDEYAAALDRAHAELRHIRATAAEAGLTVAGDDVLHPGPPPPEPAPLAPAATAEDADARSVAVQARESWARLEAAYRTAAESVAAVDRELNRFIGSSLANAAKDVREKPLLLASDFAVNGAGAAVEARAAALARRATELRGFAQDLIDRAPPGGPSGVRQTWAEHQRALARGLDVRAERLTTQAGRWLGRAGGALAVAGVVYDIAHGKPVAQAVVSGAAGFAASIGAGAAIGTLVPVPVVGTVLGAVGGAAVGLFTSGAVDSLFENGAPDVGRALADGAAAVGEAGAAVGDLATEVWDALF
jgi:hypothetical protein